MSTASRMVRAISLGVLCRSAPSTNVIIRSMNVSPRSAVIRITMRSDSTFVPPVTAERSPPDSRITGADSPVIADSSTEAMPSMISPSEGISVVGLADDVVPLGQFGRGDQFLGAVGSEPASRSLGSHPAQRVGLGLAPSLGHRLGKVGEHDRQEEPDGDGPW